MTDILHNST